jgi:branched-chain amino acid transport system substrate-binding protein
MLMKKFVAIVTLISIFMFMLAACGQKPAASTAAEGPLLLGHSATLTGGGALWGQAEQNAIDMEVEKINAAGGVLGRQIKVIRYDNKGDQTEAVNVAKRLIGDGVFAIVGPSQSGTGIAASAVTEAAKLLYVATTATNPKVTLNDDGSVKPYTFRTCFIDPYQGLVAAKFALEDLKVTKAAVLMDVGSDYSQGLSQYFKETFTAGGGTIVADEAFRSEELDYRAQLGKIKEAGAELLFIPTTQKEAGLAMKQARDLGMTCKFLGGDNWPSEDLIELGGAATEDACYVNLASLEDPTIADWVKEYTDKYKISPVMPNPVMAVDAVRVIVEAVKQTKGTDSTALADYIANIKDFPALTGKLTYDPKTHNPVNKPAVIETIKNGKFVLLKRFEVSN